MTITAKELREAHGRYDEALLMKSKLLPDLDQWYRSELRSKVEKRKVKGKEGSYLTADDLVKLMKWKLTRGKYRPRLEQLAKSNSEDLVRETTSKAFKYLDDDDSIKEALSTLNVLKGIGPATSSAIIALHNKEKYPFMSDEGLGIAAGLKGKPKYSASELKWYVEQMQKRAKEEDWKGGVEELEKAAWAYAILRQHGKLSLQDAALDEQDPPPPKKRRLHV